MIEEIKCPYCGEMVDIDAEMEEDSFCLGEANTRSFFWDCTCGECGSHWVYEEQWQLMRTFNTKEED